MSLNKTLDRLFDEIRREAKRNPEFADRLDAVLRLHESRREVSEETLAEIFSPASGGGGEQSEPEGASVQPAAPLSRRAARAASSPTKKAPALNPTGLFKREGEEALGTALAAQDLGALRALVAEHNLDPSGVTLALTRDELAQHILSQAKRRAERDEKMFEY
ncbi:MAG TPA: hypothetical protein DHW63_02365 [Hyphomonadaceae bacterium]|nr:hypothetical protein [Hyphomonadaceae bacterium]